MILTADDGALVKHLTFSGIAASLLLAVAPIHAHAIDGAALEFGSGNQTQFARGSLRWNFQRALHESERLAIKGYWDFSIAQWRGNRFRNQPGEHQNLTEIGITPMFRIQRPGGKFYAEAGIGPHLLSDVYDNNGRQLSTALQFGSQLGIGYNLSPRADVGLSIQHYSNGGIKHPNSGVNFVSMKFSYNFP
jgi:lipid A 3-O-deacylase